MVARPDLDALTPEALAALANVGLVKRAQRELAAGPKPTLHQEADGAVVAQAPDGAVSRLLVGKALSLCPCTCGAAGVCRHRIAAVLAWREAAASVVRPPWTLGPAALATWPGRALAEAAVAIGLDAQLQPQPPQVRLEGIRLAGLAPIATVAFLAGDQLDQARCDCGQRGCAHVALALMAFWQQREGSLRLGPPPAPAVIALPSVEPLLALVEETLLRGLSDAGSRAQLREGARLAVTGRVWLEELLTELEDQQAAYEARAARFRPALARQLLTELVARLRAAAAGGDGQSLLGEGEPAEVALPQTRLLSLGARLRPAEGGGRELEVLFWDGAGVVEWSQPLPAGANPAELIAPGVVNGPTIRAIATGQVQSRHLVRDARRTVSLRRGRDTQVYPQRGDWGALPPPTRVDDFAALADRGRRAPPAFLQPRDRTRDVRVFVLAGVEELCFSPGRQQLVATLVDAEGGRLRLLRNYDGAAPGALGALAAALPQARYLSGWLRIDNEGRWVEPAGLSTGEGVVVPDLVAEALPLSLPARVDNPPRPLDGPLGALEAWLERLLLDGLLRGDPRPPLDPAAIGLVHLGREAARFGAARAAGDGPGAVRAWTDLSLRLLLARAARA